MTNTGNVTLSGPFTVDDDQTTVTCPATATLPIGAHITCTATSTITQADLDAGHLTNVASATNGSVTSETDTATVNASQGPALLLAKTATPSTYAAVGTVIHYSYRVTNTGNVSLDGPMTVDDDKVTVACPAVVTLDAGDHVTCTASHTVTQADIDAGKVTNTASASADGTTSNTDSVTVTASQGPGISLVKTSTPDSYKAVGDVIDYSYVVTNTGNTSMDGPVTVTDDKITVTCPPVAKLDPGESVTCSASYSIVQSDIDAGSITNKATASVDGSVSSIETLTVTRGAAPTPSQGGGNKTFIPTPPPTDVAPDGWLRGSSAALEVLIAVWLVLASLGMLIGHLALRRPARRRGR